MKKYITLLLLITTIGVNAQTKIKSKQLGDSTIAGDSARSIGYTLHSYRDTTTNPYVDVRYYDKAGTVLVSSSMVIPASFFSNWSKFINQLDKQITKKRIVTPN